MNFKINLFVTILITFVSISHSLNDFKAFSVPQMKNTCEKDKVIVDLNFTKEFNGWILIQNRSEHEECKKDIKNETHIQFEVTRNCTDIGSEQNGNFTLIGSINSRLLISNQSFSMLIQCPPVVTSIFRHEVLVIHLGAADLPEYNLTLIPPSDKNFSDIVLGDSFDIKVDVDPTYKGAYPENCRLENPNNSSDIYELNVCDGEPAILNPWSWNETSKLLTTTFFATTFPDTNEIIFECVIVMCSEPCQNVECNAASTTEPSSTSGTTGIPISSPSSLTSKVVTTPGTGSTPVSTEKLKETTLEITSTTPTAIPEGKTRRRRSFSLKLSS